MQITGAGIRGAWTRVPWPHQASPCDVTMSPYSKAAPFSSSTTRLVPSEESSFYILPLLLHTFPSTQNRELSQLSCPAPTKQSMGVETTHWDAQIKPCVLQGADIPGDRGQASRQTICRSWDMSDMLSPKFCSNSEFIIYDIVSLDQVASSLPLTNF